MKRDKEVVKAAKVWLEENYKKGKIVPIDCCDDCDEYVIGENKCSCGNKRIEYYATGNVDDFHLVVEGYN